MLYEADKRILGFSPHTNVEDINWGNCSVIMNGKGSKQIEVYFTTECKVWLKRYLEEREDSCKALFVKETHPVRPFIHIDAHLYKK
ncbi:hypothetical protein IDH45_10435 [Paenibacillus sp. IB182363]|uniref:Uncharacterized protein n=2 Tax=Paenibacillus oceani TaxID=2772510 RepID=A0A927H0E7_9BACL|nr:hypothetical protein [Paenibacillus oceani]